MKISAEQLAAILPRSSPDWLGPLNEATARFRIDTPSRVAMFLAQVAVESAELTHVQENLDYSADRLMKVWPHRFGSKEVASRYAHVPEFLANFIYANRGGNGDSISGDGWRYRGRGPIQVTFADNYRAFAKAIGNPGIVLSPDLLLTKPVGALSAAWFFSSHGCLELADAGDVAGTTERINGPAKEGLARREEYFKTATGVL